MLKSLPLAAGALALLALTSSAAAQDPGSFRAGSAHTGVYPGPAVNAYGGLRWRVQTDGPVRSSPVAAEGTVYVGSNDGSLYAIDLATGRVHWTFTAGAPVNSTPAVAGPLVIVQSRAGDQKPRDYDFVPRSLGVFCPCSLRTVRYWRAYDVQTIV